jgi:hypothetical protein
VVNHIRVFTFLLGLFVSASVFSQQMAMPQSILATYEVTKNGQPFANVHEQFVVTGDTYKIESVTKGIGVYALLGERVLVSVGKVTAHGLKPNQFELQQGDQPKKSLKAEFDWPKQTLNMMVKGKLKQAVLTPGTQDLASYAYQFMYVPASLKDVLTMPLTTGKKLNHYQYKVKPEIEMVESAGVQYKTLHLVQAKQEVPETKELWLSTEHHYLPVRILLVDDYGQKLEQRLTELKVK